MLVLALLNASISLAPIADVRLGEEGDHVRVEVLCTNTCRVEPLLGDTYLITGAKADFIAETEAKSRHLDYIQLQTQDQGTAIRLGIGGQTPRSVSVSQCGRARLCFDLDFSPAEPLRPIAPSLADLEADLEDLMRRTGYAERHLDGPSPMALAQRTTASSPQIAKPAPQQPVHVALVQPKAPPSYTETRPVCLSAARTLAENPSNLTAYNLSERCRDSRPETADPQQTNVSYVAYARNSRDVRSTSALR